MGPKHVGSEGSPGERVSTPSPLPWVFGSFRTTVFAAVHYLPEKTSSRGQYAGNPTPSVRVEGGAQTRPVSWLQHATALSLKPGLDQGVDIRTNSRDTIC